KGRSNRLRTTGLRLLSKRNGWSTTAVRNTAVPRQKNLNRPPRNCGRRRWLKHPHRPNPFRTCLGLAPPFWLQGRALGRTNYYSRRVPFFRTKENPGTREMVPNVWTQRKAPPKRGQVYGSLRKKGYWSSASGQFRARGSVPSARTLATGVLPQSNRSGATNTQPTTT